MTIQLHNTQLTVKAKVAPNANDLEQGAAVPLRMAKLAKIPHPWRIPLLALAVAGCAASREQVAAKLGQEYIGQNVDQLVIRFGPPTATFAMNSGETSYIWQLGNQTDIATSHGSGFAATRYCKISVVAAKGGIISQLNTEDSNAGGGLVGAMGGMGSICANRLGIARS